MATCKKCQTWEGKNRLARLINTEIAQAQVLCMLPVSVATAERSPRSATKGMDTDDNGRGATWTIQYRLLDFKSVCYFALRILIKLMYGDL